MSYKKSHKELKKEEIKMLSLSSLGGILEFYDFIIFVFFTNVISELFFPSTLDPFWASLNTYGAFAAGYFARPIGGIIMAHFGDKNGRKKMFMLSIILMVVPTFILGIMPTFEVIGYAAPIILLIIRILQGIAIGGELPGAWVFVCEHAKESNRGVSVAILTACVIFGILLGSIVTLIIYVYFSEQDIANYAWRIPFILGGIFGIISVFLRKYLEETPVFKRMKEENSLHTLPIRQVLNDAKSGIITSVLVTWILTACIVIIILIIPNFIQKALILTKTNVMLMQMGAIVSISVGTVLAGFLSDRFGISKIMIIFSLLFCFASFIFISKLYGFSGLDFFIIEQAGLEELRIWYYLSAFFAGLVAFTPIIMLNVFEPSFRFSGLSASYNVSYALFGGLTIYFAPILDKVYPIGIAYYLLFIGILALIIGLTFKNINPK